MLHDKIENYFKTIDEALEKAKEAISLVNKELDTSFVNIAMKNFDIFVIDGKQYPILRKRKLAELVNKSFRKVKVNTSYSIKVKLLPDKRSNKISISNLIEDYYHKGPIKKIEFEQNHTFKLIPDLFCKTVDFLNKVQTYKEYKQLSFLIKSFNQPMPTYNKKTIYIDANRTHNDFLHTIDKIYILKSDAQNIVDLINKYNETVTDMFKTMVYDPILNTYAGQIVFKQL